MNYVGVVWVWITDEFEIATCESIHLKMYIHNLDVYNQNCIAYCLVVLLVMVFTCEYSYEFTYEYHDDLHTNSIYFTQNINTQNGWTF